MEKNGNTVPNIEKAISILELLAKHTKGLTLPDLVNETGLAKTSVFRILNTYTNHGYLIKEAGNTYKLSRKFLSLGLAAVGEESLVEKSIGEMRKLRDEINETVLLGTMMSNKIVLLEQVIGNHPFTFYLKPGKKVDLQISAPGKAYLAFADENERKELIETLTYTRYNDRTIVSTEQLLENLEEIRQQGYAIDHAEELEGVHCISAPIFSSHGHPVALLWTTGPSIRLPEDQFEEKGELLRRYADEISRKLGYKI